MGMWQQFKEFAMKRNVVDLATGVIIGAAFGKITTSLVNDIIMPPIGLVLGKIDFSSLFINLSGQPYASLAEARAKGAPVIAYGLFINVVLDFLIVAFIIFLVMRGIERLERKQDPEPMEMDCPFCATKIPIKATRCPHCTSELPARQESEEHTTSA